MLVDESFDLKDLAIGAPGSAPVKEWRSLFSIGLIAPETRPGIYNVFVSVGSRDGTPGIALPLAGDDGQRRYRIGLIEVSE